MTITIDLSWVDNLNNDQIILMCVGGYLLLWYWTLSLIYVIKYGRKQTCEKMEEEWIFYVMSPLLAIIILAIGLVMLVGWAVSLGVLPAPWNNKWEWIRDLL